MMDSLVVVKPTAFYFDCTEAMLDELQQAYVPIDVLHLYDLDLVKCQEALTIWMKKCPDEIKMDDVLETMLDASPIPNVLVFRLFQDDEDQHWVECQAYVFTAKEPQGLILN